MGGASSVFSPSAFADFLKAVSLCLSFRFQTTQATVCRYRPSRNQIVPVRPIVLRQKPCLRMSVTPQIDASIWTSFRSRTRVSILFSSVAMRSHKIFEAHFKLVVRSLSILWACRSCSISFNDLHSFPRSHLAYQRMLHLYNA